MRVFVSLCVCRHAVKESGCVGGGWLALSLLYKNVVSVIAPQRLIEHLPWLSEYSVLSYTIDSTHSLFLFLANLDTFCGSSPRDTEVIPSTACSIMFVCMYYFKCVFAHNC